jgi:type III secretory pathway component EscS
VTASLAALAREGFLLALLLAAPLLVAGLAAGIVTGLLAVFTQLQDPAVSTIVRLGAVAAAIAAFAPSIGHQIVVFSERVWPLVTAASHGGT